MYLSFSKSSFPRFLSFTGERRSLESGGKAPVIFCVKILFRSFPGVLATVSTHFVTPTAVLKLNTFRRRASPEFLASDQHVLSRRPPS